MVLGHVQEHTVKCDFCLPCSQVLCSLTNFEVRILPANVLVSSTAVSKMSHIAFDLLANTLRVILRLFIASSIISLLAPINFLVFTSVVSRELVIDAYASKTEGIVRSSFSDI